MTTIPVTSLAIDGGAPIRTTPLPPWPYFGPEDVAAVSAVLASGKVNYWTGEEGRQFEAEFAEAFQVPHAIAMSNGTTALELALYALDIGPGDEVITTTRTFIASASSVVVRGARPVLADVDRDSQNLTAATVAPLITPRTRAVIAVHLAGWPVDMAPLLELCRARGIHVIEDCAQAQGAYYHGRPVGSLGDLGAFSFCQDKIFTTGGEGGMLTLQDEALWNRAWSFKDHGKSHEAMFKRQHPPGFRWVHESFGTNMRMTEMQSALGRLALRRLPEMITVRRAHADRLRACCDQFAALRVPAPPAEVYHAYYKFYAFVRPERLKPDWNRDRIMAAIAAEGIPCLSGSCSEIYLEKAFPPEWRPAERLPVARELGETSLMFLVHPTLREADIQDMCDAIEKVMSAASLP
ncbi:MAG: DegT/DnrJ/EryC1/StrS aminotransferase family protein [Candidatus Sericytochromatia bacterium]|nr:DegT/DnrJ/EryC1/StrS aminotransferase family protein [Candidatus Sericytochromatia bacterium]